MRIPSEDFRTWAKHDPHRCRIDPDGPAVRPYPPLGTWHDALDRGSLLVALIDAIEERDCEWDVSRIRPNRYTAGVTLDGSTAMTDPTEPRGSASVALLAAYAEALRGLDEEES